MALATKFGETLIGKTGNVTTASALADAEVVGVYFSAHWCPPCRGFTPTLSEKYTELKNAGKKFELIFVSSDRDEAAFTEYHDSMTFLALPYSERQLKAQLSKEFKVNGIPALILLDGKTGGIITDEGRKVFSGDVVTEFPFDMHRPLIPQGASLAEQLGDALVGKNGSVSTASALEGKDAIGLYFSAHWCPPCRGFTPTLGEKYTELKAAGKAFELVFISGDRDENAFSEYHDTMPFLALPFSQRKRASELNKIYEVEGIPSLVILDAKSGKVITKSGRSAISAPTFVEDYPFHPKPMYDISEGLDGINDNAAFLVMMEGADKPTQTAVSEQVLAIATNERKKPEADRRVSLFFTACGGGPIPQIRGGTSLGDATTSPQMMVLDLNSQGAVYKSSDAVTPENIETFLTAFKAGSLTRTQWGQ